MTSLPPIIGLNGVARAGKDTVAKVLNQIYDYDILSFSDALNKALIALNPSVFVPPGVVSGVDVAKFWRYRDLIFQIGYEAAKEIVEVRRLLQAMGTEVGRNIFGADIWVDALFKSLPEGRRVVITNVRFPNEAEAVWSRGGVVWEVFRPGYKPALGHPSDTSLDAIQKDAYIHNDGTVEDLAQKVIQLMDGAVQRSFS